MSLDTTNYKIPGVYVESVIGYSPTAATNDAGIKIAMIGKAIGYTAKTEARTFVKGNPTIELDSVAIDDIAAVSGKYGEYRRGIDFTVSGQDVTKVFHDVGTIDQDGLVTSTIDVPASLTKSFTHVDEVPPGAYIIGATARVDSTEYPVDIDAASGSVRLNVAVEEDTLDVVLSLVVTEAQAISLNDTPTMLYCVKDGRQFAAKQIEPALSGETFNSGVTLFDANGVTTYEEGIDFVISGQRSAWTIARIPSSTNLLANTTVYAVFKETSIGADETVTIAYNHAPDNYYAPKTFTNAYDLVRYYGKPVSGSDVLSPLSLAGQMAFAHGASQIVCIPTLSDSANDFLSAFTALESVASVDIVVPLSGNTVIHDMAYDHCIRLSAQGEERRTFIGVDGSISQYSTSQMQSMAKYWSNSANKDVQRVLFVSPSSFGIANELGDGLIRVAGFYLAASIAGIVARNGANIPITNTKLSAAIVLQEEKSKLDVQSETAAGLCVVADKDGATVIHGRTVSNISIEEQELSVVLSHDHIVRVVRSALSSGIVGRPLTRILGSMVLGTVQNSMTALTEAGYCRSYEVSSIEQSEGQPTSIDVTIRYRPVYGLNYINVTIAIDPTVG